jgi:hypothetical protein
MGKVPPPRLVGRGSQKRLKIWQALLAFRLQKNAPCPKRAPSRGPRVATARRVYGPGTGNYRRNPAISVHDVTTFGSLAPLWCCQAYPECFSGFSCFVGQRSCQKLGGEIELICDWWTFPLVAQAPLARVGPGSLLSGMSGLTAQDALYASLKRNERAQSTNGLLKAQGRARARAVPKSGFKMLQCYRAKSGSPLLGQF